MERSLIYTGDENVRSGKSAFIIVIIIIIEITEQEDWV